MTAPTSPQLANTEETMTQAEESLAPIIVGAILAASVLTDDTEEPDYGPGWGVIVKGALIPGYAVARATAYGLRELVRGAVLNALIPLIALRLQLFDSEARYRGNLFEAARRAAEYAVDNAADAMLNQAHRIGHPDTRLFYDLVEQGGTDKALKIFAERTSRWLTREALFRAQTELAGPLGYTHKRWVTVGDERVRSEHRLLDGKSASLGGVFRTQSGAIRYPGDIAAPIHLWINCRCSLEFLKR